MDIKTKNNILLPLSPDKTAYHGARQRQGYARFTRRFAPLTPALLRGFFELATADGMRLSTLAPGLVSGFLGKIILTEFINEVQGGDIES